MKSNLFVYLDDFLSLIYPRLCFACGQPLFANEEVICFPCRQQLPQTHYHLQPDNPVEQQFWGRCRLNAAAGYYFFRRGSKVQHLLHALKYYHAPEVGITLGKLYGHQLKNAPAFASADCIVPVPLHPKKQKARGYNQSEVFAEGLSESMGIPVNNTSLFRVVASETQTRKSRFKRWENVNTIFALGEVEAIRGKHILLVDDVITTGATLEACVKVIETIEGVSVSVASIAVAGKGY
ncbi:MAG TPA: ComF family protein [Bacteroidales bacterium]|nr:MAG: amidophosphoribosyltransferase [Bacteroidetes bacterium GWE2_42_24]OFY25234.1 MAG: amidophosphoribosyltransferase [Bacteroidetes bacterium GWF2_43_11]HAQ65919.1 ComF family protein [Bacteroidales bacterium]HBZ66934.1 ComF family protein [Bacteroidales bacterium]